MFDIFGFDRRIIEEISEVRSLREKSSSNKFIDDNANGEGDEVDEGDIDYDAGGDDDEDYEPE